MQLMEKQYEEFITPNERIYYDSNRKSWFTNDQEFNNFLDAMAASSLGQPSAQSHSPIPGICNVLLKSIIG